MLIVTVETSKRIRAGADFGTRLHEYLAAVQVERMLPIPAYIRFPVAAGRPCTNSPVSGGMGWAGVYRGAKLTTRRQ
jgi:hypothetical protein